MPAGGNISARGLEGIVSPYLDIEGVTAAALVSTDGLLVTIAGGKELDMEGLAAHAASTLSATSGLAAELGGRLPRLITLDFDRQGLILAPLTSEVFLLLVGTITILALARQASS